jgi:hypothetical protein
MNDLLYEKTRWLVRSRRDEARLRTLIASCLAVDPTTTMDDVIDLWFSARNDDD